MDLPSHVFHRHTRIPLATAVRGEGAYIVDQTGKRYLDASGGAAVSCFGHSDRDIIEAIKTQLDLLPFAHTSFFTNEPMEALAASLAGAAPGALDFVYFTSGGSEAVEAALKMARQYHVERGEPQRRHYIARAQSYHGNTLGALAVGGNEARRAPFKDVMVEGHHILPAFEYRFAEPGEDEAAFAERAAAALEDKIQDLGEDTVIAFVAETVVGATAGAVVAPAGYFARVREICDRYGVLLILDEVMCGSGRTGSLHAFEEEDVVPDIVAVAKGLGAGYQPIGAALVAAPIFRTFEAGSGFFQHGHTFMGHAAACAGALAVQRKLQAPDMMGRVAAMGEIFAARLRDRFADHGHVGDIRGRGLFRGLELVADRATKTPFEPDRAIAAKIKQAALAAGLICYPSSGTIDGRRGDHVLLAPPFILDEDELARIAELLHGAIDAAISD